MSKQGTIALIGKKYFSSWEKIFLQLEKNRMPANRSIVSRKGYFKEYPLKNL